MGNILIRQKKEVYIPTEEQLGSLQEMAKSGRVIYQYMLTKIIEIAIIEGIVSPRTNFGRQRILNRICEEFSDYPEIVYAICRLYPEVIRKINGAEYDSNLCYQLVYDLYKPDDTIAGLDRILPEFDNGSGVLTNNAIVDITSEQLAKHLASNPQYRFEYKSNSVLDQIFSGAIDTSNLPLFTIRHLIEIDPTYATKLPLNHILIQDPLKVVENIEQYSMRYGLGSSTGIEYVNKDILTSPDDRVKKLKRCLINKTMTRK